MPADPAEPDPLRPYEPADPAEEPDPEDVEAAERAHAEVAGQDPQTSREAMELDLADAGLSEAGARVGDEMQ